MDKYIQTLVKNVRTKLDEWFNQQENIQLEDLYRFLHSIAGTAATIGFDEAGEAAKALMLQLETVEDPEWTQAKLKDFLYPLISVFYYQDVNEDIEDLKNAVNTEQKLILMIDEDTSFLMMMKEELEKNNWVVMSVANPDRTIQSYYDFHPDCVMINISNNDSIGIKNYLQLKDNMRKKFIPTIMMSQDNAKEIRLKAYQLGADDFIHKTMDMDELTIRINRQLERKQELDALIMIDNLTNVYNRNYLHHLYSQLIHHRKQSRHNFSIAMVNIDDFKAINDTNSHVTGDYVLQTFANHMKKGLSVHDVIIRYGGDVFIFLLPESTADQAKEVLDILLEEFATIPFEYGKHHFICTFSAGVVEVEENDEDLIKNIEMAEAALHQAKANGKKQVRLVQREQLPSLPKHLHIGIVDDDPIIRTMLEELVHKSKITDGYSLDIQTFTNGMEFLESEWHKRSEDPYLIVLDGMMPRMDGIEVLQNVREYRDQDKYTVIMLTSRKSDRDIARALTLGADDYITKPFKLLELETRIGHLIKRMK
ncbi:response regulator [Aquibacillus koreensis]|uniref:Response regulator n=1 Tax=Aquibacillus koreensis TaxID=279446 RepID=A0A9X4AIN6_9BACI|nr:response regulator [Aquibacillus koreensis]MCT2534892.1 response regulator [Aquibacillus koreensis]MDC3419498.1 response regulator [Aquibacillus koreensis]